MFLRLFWRCVKVKLSVTPAHQTAFKSVSGVSVRIVPLHESFVLHIIVDTACVVETGPARVGVFGLAVTVTSACGLVGSKLIGGGAVPLPGCTLGYAAR